MGHWLTGALALAAASSACGNEVISVLERGADGVGGSGGADATTGTGASAPTASVGGQGGVGGPGGAGGQGGVGGEGFPLCDGDDASVCNLFVGLHEPTSLAVSGQRLFITAAPTNVEWTDGIVYSADLASFPSPAVVIASQQAFPTEIGVVGGTVYWSNWGPNDGYSGDGEIMSCPTSGVCAPTAVHTNTTAYILSVAERLIWTEDKPSNRIRHCDAAACSPETLIDNLSFPQAMARSETEVFWTGWSGPGGFALVACEIADCQPRILHVDPSLGGPLVADDGLLYFTIAGQIAACPSDLGCQGMPEVLTTSLGGPLAMAVDATHLYFADYVMGEEGAIQRCPKPDCGAAPPEVLASGPAVILPVDLALDDTHVYWVDAQLGTVARAPK